MPDTSNAVPTSLRDALAAALSNSAQYGALSPAMATPTPGAINARLFNNVANPAITAAIGQPGPLPYTPTTTAGRLGQDVLSTAVPSLIGGGGLGAAATRLVAGAGSALASDMAPDNYYARLAAGLAGALAGGAAGAGAGGLATAARRAIAPTGPAGRAVAGELANAAGMTGTSLANSIPTEGAALTGWTPGTRPTLAAVTGNPGIANLTYSDQAAAARAGDAVYQQNASATNAAQRAAIAGVTPSDTAQRLQNLAADRDTAVNAIPAGLTAQQAGQQFRQNLQNVYDQRAAARSAGGSAFDALQNSPAQIDLRPVIDYATTQAAQNAGEVGQAYQRALAQFKSATGITLDTAPFANSVLKGLGDVASSYTPGSAAAHAVLDVKSRLQDQLESQVPEIGQARSQWAQNSRPLDVFETKPFAQVLATDRFGRSYAMPNDAVAQAFLRGNGSADSLDALNGIFGDPAAAKQALGDFMAGQVRQGAINADGSVNPAAMQRILQPYQRALIRFPDLARQFKTANGAQQALDQQAAYSRLYDTFSHGLGTMQTDTAGNPMYSAAQFDRAVEQNRPLLTQAYGPQGAAVVNQVNDELSRIAQTAYARVPGQSGTPQAMAAAGDGGGGWLGQLAGSVGGMLLEHLIGEHGGFAGAYIGSKVGEAAQGAFGGAQRFQATIDGLKRQALTDPAFAKNLVQKYNPAAPTTAAQRAISYVAQRTPGMALLPGSQPAYAGAQ